MAAPRFALLALLFPAIAFGTPKAPTVDDATQLLSRYTPGQMPVDPVLMGAIHELRDSGARTEISLLRSIVAHERDELSAAAMQAISSIRLRQRKVQREEFQTSLPDNHDIHLIASHMEKRGVAKEQAQHVAYARLLLRPPSQYFIIAPTPQNPKLLLAQGRSREALSAASTSRNPAQELIAAQAREDLGDSRGALKHYVFLAGRGSLEAWSILEEFGIDVESVLLGVFVDTYEDLDPREMRTLLSTISRSGNAASAEVLMSLMNTDNTEHRASLQQALSILIENNEFDGALTTRIQRELPASTYSGNDAVVFQHE